MLVRQREAAKCVGRVYFGKKDEYSNDRQNSLQGAQALADLHHVLIYGHVCRPQTRSMDLPSEWQNHVHEEATVRC